MFGCCNLVLITSILRTPCWSSMDSLLTQPLYRRSPWNLPKTWRCHRWCVLQVCCTKEKHSLYFICFKLWRVWQCLNCLSSSWDPAITTQLCSCSTWAHTSKYLNISKHAVRNFMENGCNFYSYCLQVPIISPTPPPMYQTSHTPDPRPSAESIDPIQVNCGGTSVKL